MATKTAARIAPKAAPTPPRPRRNAPSAKRGPTPTAVTTLVLLGVAAIVGFMLFTTAQDDGAARAGSSASAFSLPSTDGKTVSLSDFAGKPVLLYFSEGVGCDGCWYQVAELEKNPAVLSDRGISLLPIVMNTPEDTRREIARFGVTTPFLTDVNGKVSRAYDVVGSASAMHDTLPGHTFILVDGDGKIRWQGEYPEMFVPAADLAKELDRALDDGAA